MKSWEHVKDLHTCFADLGKVYGRVPRKKLWVMLWEYGVDGQGRTQGVGFGVKTPP